MFQASACLPKRVAEGQLVFMQWFCDRFCRLSFTNLLFFTKYFDIPHIVSQTVTFMISLVSRTKRSSLSFRNGLSISSTTAYDLTSLTNVAWDSWMLVRVMVLAIFLVLFRSIIFQFGDHFCYFGTSHHLTPESWQIVGKTYCTTGSFDDFSVHDIGQWP